MPHVIQQLPFGIAPSEKSPSDSQKYNSYVMYLWVSITESIDVEPTSESPCFRVVFDTGFDGQFLMRDADLAKTIGKETANKIILRPEDKVPNAWKKHPIEYHEATVWLWPNIVGKREPDRQRKAVPLDLSFGIALIGNTREGEAPDKPPLLGIQAVLFG